MRRKENRQAVQSEPSTELFDIPQNETLHRDLDRNAKILKEILSNSFDVVFRPIHIPEIGELLIIFVDGLINSEVLDEDVLKPFLFNGRPEGLRKRGSLRQLIEQQLIPVAQTKTVSTIGDVVMAVLKAGVVILADGEHEALVADLHGFATRAIVEPNSEVAVRGPKEGFTESLIVNTSMVRRKIPHPGLVMERFNVGTITQTGVVVAYIKGIAAEPVINEVRTRITNIQIDSVIDTGYIEEFIEDATFSPFPTVQNTERPDVVAATLLEGKVAIIADGTPNALIVPLSFWISLQSNEDYYERFIYSTVIRLLRLVLYMISLVLPSLYVAVTTFHPQLMPTPLLLSVAAAREGIPFPSMIEALLMEFMFEGLREAGLRLPKPIGSAVSIVGALVIGQTAVQAGIVSAPMVIVIALTGIASFAIPRYNMGIAHRLVRFPLLFLAGTLGIFGVTMGCIFLLIHLSCLRSFGQPYLAPISPYFSPGLKDTFFRFPRWSMTDRPGFGGPNQTRIPRKQPANRMMGRKWR